jgi:transketolase
MVLDASFLKEKASEIRRDVVRMIGLARSGHLLLSLAIVDILAWLYWEVLSIDPEDPWRESRDRFILGKGHGCPALYATLANRKFFERDELWSYRRLGAMLQGYPQALRTPGVDSPGGSSSMGLGLANGLALALRHRGIFSRIFCLAGDSELQEGVFWESAISSAHFSLENVFLLVDRSSFREEETGERPRLEPLREKLLSFGWAVDECDGHEFDSLRKSLDKLELCASRPKCLLARTRLGKGISFLEDDKNAGRAVLDRERMDKALRELEKGSEF